MEFPLRCVQWSSLRQQRPQSGTNGQGGLLEKVSAKEKSKAAAKQILA
jgi:hypothetical protein